MFAKPVEFEDLGALWGALDEATDGGLWSLRHECETNGWTPNLWAQTPEEGGPLGLTRVLFIGCDSAGRTMYFDRALIRDTEGLALQIKVAETTREAARDRRSRKPYTIEVRGLN
jgi:hypothetical protein